MVKNIGKKSHRGNTSKPQVHIVGPLKLQNDLMAWYLQQTTGLPCASYQAFDLDKFPSRPKGLTSLVLLDCLGNDATGLRSKIRALSGSSRQRYYIALFNMAAGQPFGNELVKKGVRGIFYNDDPLSNLAKGVPTILKGELWLSRKDLMKCLLDSSDANGLAMEVKAFLTSREKEILILIASGISNSQIAETLSISRNTVKTHLYNIYHKIKVPNRLQAALWAAKYL